MNKQLVHIILMINIFCLPIPSIQASQPTTFKEKITNFCNHHPTISRFFGSIGLTSLFGVTAVIGAKVVANSVSGSHEQQRTIMLILAPTIHATLTRLMPILLPMVSKPAKESYKFHEIEPIERSAYIGPIPEEAYFLAEMLNSKVKFSIDQTEHEKTIEQQYSQLNPKLHALLFANVPCDTRQSEENQLTIGDNAIVLGNANQTDKNQLTIHSNTIEDETRPSGFIFHGPGGTGKTTLIQVIAGMARDQEIKPRIFGFKMSDLDTFKYAHQYTHAINAMIYEIIAKLKPGEKAILTMEECDSLLGSHSKKITDGRAYLNNFLKQALDKCKEKGIIFVGTTNHLGTLNPQLMRRLTFVPMGLPNKDTRKELLHHFTKKYLDTKTVPGFENFLSNLSVITEGFSQGNIEELISTFRRKKINFTEIGQKSCALTLHAQLNKVAIMRRKEAEDEHFFNSAETNELMPKPSTSKFDVIPKLLRSSSCPDLFSSLPMREQNFSDKGKQKINPLAIGK